MGKIQKAGNIGFKRHKKHIWLACITCGKERWVQIKKQHPTHLRCRSCGKKESAPRGENASSWKGGRTKTSKGYINITLQPDDFFFSMTRQSNKVLEHRLVMAQHLGRCLHQWELVHHLNGIKDDNRIENLQLVTDDRHYQITVLENKIDKLIEGQRGLMQEIKLLRWENSQLKNRV